MERDSFWMADWEQARISREEAERRVEETFAGKLTAEEVMQGADSPMAAAQEIIWEVRELRSYDAEVDHQQGIPKDLEELLAGHLERVARTAHPNVPAGAPDNVRPLRRRT